MNTIQILTAIRPNHRMGFTRARLPIRENGAVHATEYRSDYRFCGVFVDEGLGGGGGEDAVEGEGFFFCFCAFSLTSLIPDHMKVISIEF